MASRWHPPELAGRREAKPLPEARQREPAAHLVGGPFVRCVSSVRSTDRPTDAATCSPRLTKPTRGAMRPPPVAIAPPANPRAIDRLCKASARPRSSSVGEWYAISPRPATPVAALHPARPSTAKARPAQLDPALTPIAGAEPA